MSEKDQPVSLSQAAELITKKSGYPINRDALRNQIARKKWPFPSYRVANENVLMLFDVEKYAETFRGIKIGRPKKLK
jgi:hypothetical protein